MATPTTTHAAVRDRVIAVILGLTPTTDPLLGFREHLNELDADLRRYAVQNPQGMTRVFQVRDTFDDAPPAVTNLDLEEEEAVFEVIVAYAQDQRFGPDGALARDTVIRQDQKLIEKAIGLGGRENFTAPTYPDAYWSGAEPTRREIGTGVDFLVIRQTLRFKRAL